MPGHAFAISANSNDFASCGLFTAFHHRPRPTMSRGHGHTNLQHHWRISPGVEIQHYIDVGDSIIPMADQVPVVPAVPMVVGGVEFRLSLLFTN